VGHDPTPYSLTAQRCSDFLQTLLPGLPEDVPLAVRQKLWLNVIIQEGGLDTEGLLDGLLARRMDFTLWGHLKDHVYAFPPWNIEDLIARLEADMTTADANMLRRV
jgi:hypothetical protein